MDGFRAALYWPYEAFLNYHHRQKLETGTCMVKVHQFHTASFQSFYTCISITPTVLQLDTATFNMSESRLALFQTNQGMKMALQYQLTQLTGPETWSHVFMCIHELVI